MFKRVETLASLHVEGLECIQDMEGRQLFWQYSCFHGSAETSQEVPAHESVLTAAGPRWATTRMSTRHTTEHREDADPFSQAPSRSTLHISAPQRGPRADPGSLRSLRSLAKSRGVMCNHKVGLHHGSVWNGCCGGTTVFYLDLLAVTLTSCASDLHGGRTLLPDVWSTK